MRIPRIYTSQELRAGHEVLLPEQAGEHVVRVLRLDRGHPVILINGDGREYDARLASLAKRSVTALITASRDVDRESGLKVTLVQSIARGEKMDWILQKATELGVSRIVPLVTERTEVKLGEDRAERRMNHWTSVIESACEQSGRTTLPSLTPPQRIDRWLVALDDRTVKLALVPDGDTSLKNISVAGLGATIVVGPEGGLSEQDVTMLMQAGFVGLKLGPRVLRTETAGVAALAALQALFGDF